MNFQQLWNSTSERFEPGKRIVRVEGIGEAIFDAAAKTVVIHYATGYVEDNMCFAYMSCLPLMGVAQEIIDQERH